MPEDIHLAEGGGGFGATSGARVHLAGAPAVVLAANALATRRGDHLGLTLVRRRAVLAAELPQGTSLYVALFSRMPNRLGEGGTEVSVSGYARRPVSSWTMVNVGASAKRTNAASITWAAFGAAVTVVGWGIWSALTDGSLRAFDYLRAVESLDPITYDIPVNGQPGFTAGDIGLVL